MFDWLGSLIPGLLNAILLAVMLFGLFGLVIPIFPGGFVIWLAALIYGFLNGFQGAGPVIFLVITVFMVGGVVVDDIFMAAAARRTGASWWSVFFAFFGGVLGTFIFPPFGGLLGAPVAFYISEYVRQRDIALAWVVTRGMMIGWGWSFVARFFLGVLMIGIWFGWVLFASS